MASISDDDDDNWVVLECIDPHCTEVDTINPDDDMILSTAEMDSWDLSSISARQIIRVKADRNRLIQHSTYFSGLLSGSFRESCSASISIHWNLQLILNLLKIIHGDSVEITSDTFLQLFEGALFFGVDMLLLNCKIWFTEVTSVVGFLSLQLNDLISIWKFSLEHANDFLPKLCTEYLAKNFMCAVSYNSFSDIPCNLLLSCLKHPQLTVCSEKHLCNTLLVWLGCNIERISKEDGSEILKQIRVSLLPLWFATGKKSCHYFSEFSGESIQAIFSLLELPSKSSLDAFGDGDLGHLRIRLTEYTKQLDLSGCPQMILAILLLSLLPASYSMDPMLRKTITKSPMKYGSLYGDKLHVQLALPLLLTFEAVEEVDISNCPMLHLEAAIECFSESFPSLRILRAAYFVNFETKKLSYLVERCPLLDDIDLTVDVNPIVSSKVTTLSPQSAMWQHRPTVSHAALSCPSAASLASSSRLLSSNIARLTLEGRIDVTDYDLHNISKLCVSLTHLNLKGCTSISDSGIAAVVLECVRLHSIVVCETSFGQHSVMALCSCLPSCDRVACAVVEEKNSISLANKLQTLHIGGCQGVDEKCLTDLMSQTCKLSSLCLKGTNVVDSALYSFSGSSLEMLDISCTKISATALAYVIGKNPGLTRLGTRDCKNLYEPACRADGCGSYSYENLYIKLGRSCQLEDIAVGWGFSYVSINALISATKMLRKLTVGLGGSLGQDGLELLVRTCPLLESLTLYFQVIWDSVIVDVLVFFSHLQELSLCYCFGEISFSSFQFIMPNLRKLRLERVARLMTNDDLVVLTRNCSRITELSLLGCTLLNSESQGIVSSGWPGLTYIHLEDCGKVTANGVADLFECYALEDLLLRHNGDGIPRNIILRAASKMPMLRKVSLDLCDAKDGDYDIPEVVDRYFLSSVKIARCKFQRCSLDLQKLEAQRTSVHKETLVMFILRKVIAVASRSSTSKAENDTHDGKRKCETLWPIFKIAHQKSRYVFDLYHCRKEISKELFEFCLDQGYANCNLIAKWKKICPMSPVK